MQEKNIFHCSKCNYSTTRNYDYRNHLISKKHNKISETTSYICNKCQKSFTFSSGLSRHQNTCKIIQNDNIFLLLNEKFHNTKNFIDIMKEIRIDNNYYSSFKEKDYVNSIKPILKEKFQKIDFNEIPIFCIRNENPEIDVIYIRDNDKWIKENKYVILKQIMYELENDFKEKKSTSLLKGFHFLERNIMNDIPMLFKKKISGYYEFEKKNSREMTYYMNRMELVDYFIELIKINKEDFQNKVFELSQTKTEL